MTVPELALHHQRLEARATQLHGQIERIEAELARNPETETEREAVWRQLPADWQKAYRRVAARVSNPVAEVVRGQCQACHVGATSSGMQMLRRGSLVLCENCGRLQVAT